jgi:hypothetical protein
MNEESNKMSEEEFVINAIKKLRKPPYKGIHCVFSGFNGAFREYFGKNSMDVTQRLANEGKIIVRPVKGGIMLYLPGDFPQIPKPNEIIKKIVGENEGSEGQTIVKEEKDYERPIKEIMKSLNIEKRKRE